MKLKHETKAPLVKFALCCFLTLASPAHARWLWDEEPACAPLDRTCLIDAALVDLNAMADEVSTNAFGRAFGAVWPHLDTVTRQSVLDDYVTRPNGIDVVRHVNIALSKHVQNETARQQLEDLLKDHDLAGALPLEYFAAALAAAALRIDPEGTADLAIANGPAFAQAAIDELYRTISWMARNDLPRLEAYLKANNPPASSYFIPANHLFRIAAEQCAAGQNGSALMDIAMSDMLATRVQTSERFAFPIRAILACDGLEAANENVDLMMYWLAEDLARQIARGSEGAFIIQRIVTAVNEHGLAPVIRALHQEGRQTEAKALAELLLPEAQVVVSVGVDGDISIDAEDVQAKLTDILAASTELSSHLDPATSLRWFVSDFDPEAHLNSPDYAKFAIDPILRLWPEPLARDAARIAAPLLNESEFHAADVLRLDIGIARIDASDCAQSMRALETLVKRIEDLDFASLRVNAIADYLVYLDHHDASLPTCDKS